MMKIARLLPLFALALAACQQDQPATPAQGATEAASAAPAAKPGLALSGATLVLPAVSGNPGAVYFTLTNGSDQPATLAAVSIDGAAKAEMHETKGGTMVPVNTLAIKAGETVKFERGGYHVMAFELAAKLTPGATGEVTLTFADGDKLSAPLKVEAAGGAAMMMEGHDMEKMDHDMKGMDHSGDMH